MLVDSLNRTKNDIVIEQIKAVLKVKTFRELVLRTIEAKERLQDLNVFKYVVVKFDTDKRNRTSDVGTKEEVKKKADEAVEVTFLVKEQDWFSVMLGIWRNVRKQSGDTVSQ